METSEKVLEVLQKICDKLGIVMDKNILSLSELAQNITDEIVIHYLISSCVDLAFALIAIIICYSLFKRKNEQELYKDRIQNLLGLFDKEKSRLRKRMENKSFSLENYIIEFVFMSILLIIILAVAFSCASYIINIIRAFACPDLLVVDYFMDYYLKLN